MATIVTRAGKGSALTNNEVDANFTNLNNDKIEIDRGSNANGEYVEFSDGTILCTRRVSLGTYTDNKATSNLGSYTMPASYTSTPAVQALIGVSSSSAAYVTALYASVGSPSSTSWSNVCKLALSTQSDSGVGVTLNLSAIGTG